MLKLFKYLKTSIFSILIIIALLVCQAELDLALPDYTSKIINVGIQQNGIEDAVPSVMTVDTYNNLMLLMNGHEKDTVSTHYTLISKNNKD